MASSSMLDNCRWRAPHMRMQALPWSLLHRFGFNEIPRRRIDDPAFATVVAELGAPPFDRGCGPKVALFVPGAARSIEVVVDK